MNIFKILANGDGIINEPNVSAFGIPLNPSADHTLRFEFLKRFLEPVVEGEDFNVEKYDYEIFFEQGFTSELGKQIVDIVIVCYTTDRGEKRITPSGIPEEYEKVEKIFLIENKIKEGSFSPGQLSSQFKSTLSQLGESFNSEIFYSIYITPDTQKLREEFAKTQLNNKTHLFWKSEQDDSSIQFIIQSILMEESKGLIEPLNDYTLHTIKAFYQFIETDFKSEIEEKRIRTNDGTYTLEFIKLNESTNIEVKLNEIRSKLLSMNPDLSDIIGVPDFTSKRQPVLPFHYKGIRLVLVPNKPRNKIVLAYTVDKYKEESFEKLNQLATIVGLEVKNAQSKFHAYCRSDEMKKQIEINDITNISEAVNTAIELINVNLN